MLGVSPVMGVWWMICTRLGCQQQQAGVAQDRCFGQRPNRWCQAAWDFSGFHSPTLLFRSWLKDSGVKMRMDRARQCGASQEWAQMQPN